MPAKKQKKRKKDTSKNDHSTVFFLKKNIQKLKQRQLAQMLVLLLAIFFIGASVASSKIKTLRSVKVRSITNPYIRDGAVDSAKIQDGSVSNADLADNSVTSGKIADGEIIADDIRDGTITAAKMAAGVLTSDGSGSSAWGSITGTLSDQTDLQNALDDKADKQEITVGDEGYGSTFAEAITAIASTQATLIVPSGTHEGGGVTVPANVTLKIYRGALIHQANGTTLTISGDIEAGLYQVFSWDGLGKAVIGSEASKIPEWWGAAGNDTTDDSAALQAWATAGGNLYLPKKTYKITAGIIVPQYTVIDGLGTIHQTNDTKEGLIVYDDVTVKNIELKGCGTVPATPGNPGGYHHLGLTSFSIYMDASDGASAMSTYVGKRTEVDNVTFTGGWERCIVLTSDNTVKHSTFLNNLAEAILFHGINNKAVFNTIDGIGSWAIDFNGGNAEASFNVIKNTAQDSSYSGDAGGIAFAGLSIEKPMTNLRAIGNSIDDCKYGYGITVISKPTDGVWGDIAISDNYINGDDAVNSLIGIYLYVGAGSTVTCKNLKVTNNTVKNFQKMLQGVWLDGGVIQGNIGKTFAPIANTGAIQLGAITNVVVEGNVVKDVNGAGDTVMRIEGANNNNKIINNIGEGANVGFFNADAAGTKNDISGNDFSGCTYPIYLDAVPLAAGNRLERNIGFVPYNALAPGVSESEILNSKGYPIIVTVSGGTDVSVSTGSVTGHLTATGLTAGQLLLPAGWIIQLSYANAPTWVWEGTQ